MTISGKFRSKTNFFGSSISSLYRSQDDIGYYTSYSNVLHNRNRFSSDSLKSFATPESFSSEDNVPIDSSEEMFHQLFVPDRTDDDEDDRSGYNYRKSSSSSLSQRLPIEAKLVADGVSVLYKAPPPPMFDSSCDFLLNTEDAKDEFIRGELDEFREKVASASPMRRSETSSVSLGMTWCSSSRDSLLNSPLEEKQAGQCFH